MDLHCSTVLRVCGLLLILLTPVVLSCASTPAAGINPSAHISTASGSNNSQKSETLYNSVKTIATLNLSGHIGSLVVFSIVFLLIVAVYKKLKDFLVLVNERLHGFANLFGIHGFVHNQPAIELEEK